MNKTDKLVTYSSINNSINNFRNHEEYDEPGTFYFKLFFYFNNDKDEINSNLLGLDISSDNDSIETDLGLISQSHPNMTWSPETLHKADQGLQDGIVDSAAYSKNTAYNYLVINGEVERAEYLKRFIYLLSELSSNRPWYFQSIENISDVLSRNYQGGKEFKIEEQEKSINIKCLQDPVDNIITNLLNLYRSACFSHIWKKEVVPANLRKFDMGIFIFQRAREASDIYTQDMYKTTIGNYKYIELIDCEIDPESIKTTYNTLNNAEGTAIEPTITIKFSDSVIHNRDERIGLYIGDLIETDLNPQMSTSEVMQYSIKVQEEEKEEVQDSQTANSEGLIIPIYDSNREDMSPQEKILGRYKLYTNPYYKYRDDGFFNDLLEGTVGRAINYGKSLINKAILGNVNGLSIKNIAGSIQQIKSGDIIGGASRTISEINKVTSSGTEVSKKDLGNVFADEAKINTMMRNI